MKSIPGDSWQKAVESCVIVDVYHSHLQKIPAEDVVLLAEVVERLRSKYGVFAECVQSLRDKNESFRDLADHDIMSRVMGFGMSLTGFLQTKRVKPLREHCADYLGEPESDDEQAFYDRLYWLAMEYCSDEAEEPIISDELQAALDRAECHLRSLGYLRELWRGMLSNIQRTRQALKESIWVSSHALASIGHWVEGHELMSAPVNLTQSISDGMGALRTAFGKAFTLDFDLEENVMAHVHIGTVVTLLFNMVRNATKHGKADKLLIRLRTEDDAAVLEVLDNGTGVMVEQLDRIFERGFSGGQSTGLGLGSAKERLAAMKGTISCEPHGGIDDGAKFVMRFAS